MIDLMCRRSFSFGFVLEIFKEFLRDSMQLIFDALKSASVLDSLPYLLSDGLFS